MANAHVVNNKISSRYVHHGNKCEIAGGYIALACSLWHNVLYNQTVLFHIRGVPVYVGVVYKGPWWSYGAVTPDAMRIFASL